MGLGNLSATDDILDLCYMLIIDDSSSATINSWALIDEGGQGVGPQLVSQNILRKSLNISWILIWI